MTDILIVGVDPSSAKLAATIAVPGSEPKVVQRKTTLSRDRVRACVSAYDWMTELVGEYPDHDVYVFIEAPVFGRGGPGSTIPQAQINGALTAAASKAGATVTSVNNAHCKKEVVGKGNANKDDIAAWCKTAWPKVYKMTEKDQDLIDSAMIWVYGRGVLKMRARLAAKRRTHIRRSA